MDELEKTIRDLVERKNAARDDSAEQKFCERQLQALRYRYEEAGGLIEHYDPMGWGCYCRPLADAGAPLITMKKQVVAAAIAIFVSHSAAKAIDIKSYDANPAFARKIGTWYEQAPAELKDRMFNPLVIVVKDRDILNTKIMQGAIHAPESTVPNRPDISAFANKGTPGKMPRRIIFIQSAMLKDIDEWQRHTVLHEMMHLFDGHPELFWRSRLQWLSNEAEFLAMFIAEKADYERKPKSKYNKWFDYYFSSPQEAYAEAGARAILPLVGARYREYNPEFDRLFSRVIGYVRKQLTEAGVKVR